MYLLFFDESKDTCDKRLYVLGGYVIAQEIYIQLDDSIADLQEQFFGNSVYSPATEFHAKDIYHGKGTCKNVHIYERLEITNNLFYILKKAKPQILLTKINVEAHEAQYTEPMDPGDLAAKILFENFHDFLVEHHCYGWAYGDEDGKNSKRVTEAFSKYKLTGTPYIKKSVNRINQVTYTKSYSSRLLQLADLISFFFYRFDGVQDKPLNYADRKFFELWKSFESQMPIRLQTWAPKRANHGFLSR